MIPIKLDNPTTKDVINAVLKYLENLDNFSYDYNDDICLYRDRKNNTACLVGAFLEDEQAVLADQLNIINVYQLVKNLDECPDWFETHCSLLNDIQEIHDKELVAYSLNHKSMSTTKKIIARQIRALKYQYAG